MKTKLFTTITVISMLIIALVSCSELDEVGHVMFRSDEVYVIMGDPDTDMKCVMLTVYTASYDKDAESATRAYAELLISGYQPPPHPEKEFFDDMGKLLESGDRLAEAARHMGKGECRSEVIREAGALKELRMEIERKYLTTKEENIWR